MRRKRHPAAGSAKKRRCSFRSGAKNADTWHASIWRANPELDLVARPKQDVERPYIVAVMDGVIGIRCGHFVENTVASHNRFATESLV